MTCCSSGKARVYFNIPQKGGLKYRLKGEKVWITITADERLTSSCTPVPNSNTKYLVSGTFTEILTRGTSITTKTGTFFEIITGPILGYEIHDPNNARVKNMVLFAITPLGNQLIAHPGDISLSGNESVSRNYGTPTATRIDNGQDPVEFIIKGTESENIYIYLELPECPAVQTIPCKFDPAKEQHLDVEMIPYTELPIPLPSYPLFQDCIEITTVGNFTVIEKVTTRNYGPKADNDPTVRETRKILKTLDSAENCPPPKVRVECCTTPDCHNNKKCPKGTTCEIVCGGFKCCYSKGVLIRSIKL
jgi:hypothetical protein